MYYSDDIIEEVRRATDIVDVIGGYVALKKKGNSYFGLCPFHNEKTGSFSVSRQKQMYYCFGCGAGGNVFTFLMEYENASFVESVQILADRAGIALPEVSQTAVDKRLQDEKNLLFAIEKEAAKFYYIFLKSEKGAQAMRYLKDRGLSDETIQKFGLGASAKFSDSLYIYLKNKSYTDKQLADSGLIVYDEKKGAYDRFWNRVMFPIMDVGGRVIGFGGRVMGDGKPKYLNSPESIIFEKSRNLYGLNIARTSREKNILLCEGYMDVIAMHQAGFNNAVASLGTAFTPGHANLLKRYTEEVLLLYDSDEAGTKAALRAIPILSDAGLSAKVVDLSPYKDPDDLVKAIGPEGLKQRLETAMDSFLFEIKVLRKGYDMNTPKQATEFYKVVAGRLLSFQTELERKTYTQAVANMLQISYKELAELVTNEGIAHGGRPVVERPKSAVVSDKRPKDDGKLKAQRLILTWICDEPKLYKAIKKYLTYEDFSEGIYKEVAKALFGQLDRGEFSPASITSAYQQEEDLRVLAQIFNTQLEHLDSEDKKADVISELIYKIRALSLEQEKEKLNLADMSAMQQFIKKKQELDKIRNLHISPEEWEN